MAQLGKEIHLSLIVDTSGVSKGLADANKQFSTFANGVQRQSNAINVSTSSIVQGFAAISGINLGIAGLREFGSEVLKMTGMMQGLALSFETMLGNKAAADKMMQDVKQFALDTPYTITETATIVKQLIAMNAAGDDVMKTYKALGDVAAGLNVPISRIAINFGQVAALGRLQAREIRDFAMAGVPIYDALSESMGKSVQEIQAMTTAGQIGFPQVLAAFKMMSDEGGRFANMMEKLNSTVAGQMNRLTDQIQQMFAKVGESNKGMIYGAISGASSLVANYEKIIAVLKTLVITYGSVKAAQMLEGAARRATVDLLATNYINGNVQAVTRLAVAGRMLTNVWKGLGVALKSAGVGLVISAAVHVILMMIDNIRELNKVTREMGDAANQAKTSINSEILQFEIMYDRLRTATKGTKEYELAKKAIIDQYGTYLTGLGNENASVKTLEESYEALRDAIAQAARERGLQSLMTKQSELVGQQLTDSFTAIEKIIQKRFKDDPVLADRYMREIAASLHRGGEGISEELQAVIDSFNKKSLFGNRVNDSRIISHDVDNAITDEINKVKKAQDETTAAIETHRKLWELSDLAAQATINTVEDANKRIKELTSSSFDDIDFALKDAISKYNKIKNDVLITDEQKQAQDLLVQGLQAEYDARVKTGNVSLKYAKEQLAIIEAQLSSMDAIERAGEKGAELRKKQQQAQDLVSIWSTADAKTTTGGENSVIEAERKLTSLLIQLDNERRADVIANMKDGLPKELEQIDEDYRLKLLEIRKQEAELRAALLAAGKRMSAEQIAMYRVGGTLDTKAEEGWTNARKAAIDQEVEDEQDKFRRLVEQYGDYNQRRQQILEEGEKTIANTPSSLVDGVKKAIENELASLGDEFGMFSQGIEDLFERSSRKTTSELQKIIDKGKQIGAALKSGDYSAYLLAEGDSVNKLSEEQFNINSKDAKFLEDYADKLKELQRLLNRTTISFTDLSTSIKNVFSGKATFDDWEKLQTQLENINQVSQAVGESISQVFAAFGKEDASGVLEDITNLLGGVAQTGQGIAQIASGNIVEGIVNGVKGIANTITSLVTLSDRGNESTIKSLQVRYDELSNVIDDIDSRIENIRRLQDQSYAQDRQNLIDEESKAIEESNKRIQEQNALIAQQIQEERDKSNTDDDRIVAWQKQIDANNKSIEENNLLLEDNKQKRIDAIYGSDIQSAISDFAQAYADAWTKGVPSGQNIKEAVKNMMKQAVMQIIMSEDDLSKALMSLRDTLIPSFLADNIISNDELKYIEDWANSLGENLDNKYSGLMGIFQDEQDTASRTSASQGFAQASQDSIDAMFGVIVNIENSVHLIKEFLLKERDDASVALLNNIVTQVTAIRANTDRLQAVEDYLRIGNSTMVDVRDNLRQLNR